MGKPDTGSGHRSAQRSDVRRPVALTKPPASRWLAQILAVALALCAFACPPIRALAMTMIVNGHQVSVSDMILLADAGRFEALISSHPEIKTVVLWDSPGGNGAERIGAIIESHNLDTAAYGYCISTCAMIFLAGTNRYFADREPIALSSIGFHGAYDQNLNLISERGLQRVRSRVIERTGGKVSPDLLDRWLHLEDHQEVIAFRHPSLADGRSHASVFYCKGNEPFTARFERCEPIEGVDALSSGIITSATIYHVR